MMCIIIPFAASQCQGPWFLPSQDRMFVVLSPLGSASSMLILQLKLAGPWDLFWASPCKSWQGAFHHSGDLCGVDQEPLSSECPSSRSGTVRVFRGCQWTTPSPPAVGQCMWRVFLERAVGDTSILTMQVPPFIQGVEAHSLMSAWQLYPVHPGRQVQL